MGLGNGLYFLMSFEGSSYWFESVNRGRAFLRELSKNHRVRHNVKADMIGQTLLMVIALKGEIL